MSLPEITQLELNESNTSSTSASSAVHKTYDWDFDAGDFKLKDGKIVEVTGLDYVKIWIKKALLSWGKSYIYKDTDYGSEHMELLGATKLKPVYLYSEFERLIKEALLINDALLSVENFHFEQTASRLLITFNVQSIYGSVEEEVYV
ncbi:hypothetical protein BK126_04405 [Paenibacillus sp. FSL H7-0326]|uniref:DUF2634 domain-containing protein n=2 Tax=Bacillati TaxID=1783272 RepID=UPI00096F83CC|nr:DUF2634 domain-containing protein [Paenibacillus sp. FSL H7-0326]OMC71344.1 hypothetical protein BK126_04405 [Paenibacillus sp. FSL H7-0326]